MGTNIGTVRLLQSYLRVMGYFGDPNAVRGVDVVTGVVGSRTQRAMQQFTDRHGGEPVADNALLARVEDRYETYLRTLAPRSHRHDHRLLDKTFNASGHAFGNSIRKLHPAMRWPLAAALDDLSAQGIPVRFIEGRRSAHKQESMVRNGVSTAPPGSSFHEYGLAVDLAPYDDSYNRQHPHWQPIIRTLEKHGFSSLYRLQGWDMPHFELPAKTAAMMRWPIDKDGWKEIPPSHLPARWAAMNQARTAVARAYLPVVEDTACTPGSIPRKPCPPPALQTGR